MRYASLKKLGVLLPICLVGVVAIPSYADDENNRGSTLPTVSKETIRESAARALRLIEKSSAEYLNQRQCSSCHHQTLPLIVFKEAHEVGLEINEKNFRRQLDRVHSYHNSRLEGYLAAKDNGEQVHTPGYGLWGLDVGGHEPDKLTEAVVGYLLAYQKELGHWLVGLDRRPAEASDFTTNYLALRAVNRFGVSHQKKQIEARSDAVKQWLAKTATRDTEDEVFRLRLAHELQSDTKDLKPLVEELIDAQHDNGGWAQTTEMTSDAYATGSVLVALHEAGEVPTDHPAWQRGLNYLLRTQKPDGSWHVVTRAKPMQEYFESGFPYGKDQFISAFATGWATKAVLVSLRKKGR